MCIRVPRLRVPDVTSGECPLSADLVVVWPMAASGVNHQLPLLGQKYVGQERCVKRGEYVCRDEYVCRGECAKVSMWVQW